MRTTNNSRRVPATRQNVNIQNNFGVKTTIRTSSSLSSSLLRGSNTHDNDNNKKKPTVGIIGGGIAGLSCARHLQYAYDVTVVS
jgi:NADH dehydrogenase FAD-containing subunit